MLEAVGVAFLGAVALEATDTGLRVAAAFPLAHDAGRGASVPTGKIVLMSGTEISRSFSPS